MENLARIEYFDFETNNTAANIDDFNTYLARLHPGARSIRRRVQILNAWIDDVLVEEAVMQISDWSNQRRHNPELGPKQVVTLNPEYLTIAQRDQELMQIINQAELVTPDGIGLIYASKVLGCSLRGRVTGVALTCALARHSAKLALSGEGELRLFLLGAAPGVAEEASHALKQRFPGVAIAGTYAGYGGPEGDAETVQAVREAQADVVLVAYGIGKQDRWIIRNLKASGASIGIGVGGTFDYLARRVPMPPEIVKQLGLEWAYRIVTQKGRWKRAHFVPRFIMAVASSTFVYWLPGNQA